MDFLKILWISKHFLMTSYEFLRILWISDDFPRNSMDFLRILWISKDSLTMRVVAVDF